MKKINLETQILAAFHEGLNKGLNWLTNEDIGIMIWGNGYIPQTAHIFNKMIKERMWKVRELAEQEGTLIIPMRKRIPNSTRGFKITAWKIATIDDRKYIEDELMYKLHNGDSRKKSTIRFVKTAVASSMLPPVKLHELTE